MKKVLIICAALLSLSACTTTQKSAGVGAVAGGVVGAVTTGSVVGTVIGAGVGAVAGAVIGEVANQPGKCYYKDRRGNTYIDTCPRG